MSLERFRRTKLVTLNRQSKAYQAARAMADNHIGAVLVSDPKGLAGIVTDRDCPSVPATVSTPQARRCPSSCRRTSSLATSDRSRPCRELMVSTASAAFPSPTEAGGPITLDDLVAEVLLTPRRCGRSLRAA
jgi:signal-transduction protein with cAMP-binding, CBS, and nucleotidyltransferase domain